MSNIDVQSIKLEPVDVILGRRERTKITTVADVTDSLNETYFTIYSAKDATKYYVWFDTGSGVDPAPSDHDSGIQVSINTDDTAEAVATALQSTLSAEDDFAATKEGADVFVETVAIGDTTNTSDSGSTGFTFEEAVAGVEKFLGATQGGVEVSPTQNRVDVQADQTGEQLLDQIFNGVAVTVGATLLEVGQDQWRRVVGDISGDILPGPNTPEDDLIGFGTSKNFLNLSSFTSELILKPVSATDNSRNLHFWKAAPIPSSITFSGSDLRTMEVEFSALVDLDKKKAINLFAYGDGNRDVNA
jgi:hypothetical protein